MVLCPKVQISNGDDEKKTGGGGTGQWLQVATRRGRSIATKSPKKSKKAQSPI